MSNRYFVNHISEEADAAIAAADALVSNKDEADSYQKMVKYAAYLKNLYNFEKEQKELAQAERDALLHQKQEVNNYKDAYQRYADWPKNTVYYKAGAQIRYAYDSAGMDVAASQDYTIQPGESALISTGLYMQPAFNLPEPFSLAMQVWPRSGLSVNKRLETGAGLIDPDYRGEIKIHLYNHGTAPFFIDKGGYVAQIVFCAVIAPSKISFVESDALSETKRNINGFGSTGV